MSTITLPYKFTPREYQLPILKALDSGIKRAVWVCHRRAGKDKTLWNYMIKASSQRIGAYFYFLPTYRQAKKIIWDGIDGSGFRVLDHIPKEYIKSLNDTELKINLRNGSIIQLVGTDRIDYIMGTNPVGCVFSEYSLQNPEAWGLIRPILAENNGWASFIYTPRGNNHGKSLYQQALQDPNWFVEVLTVDDTKAIPQEILDKERKEMLELTGDDALYMQEYMCSFTTSLQGSYFGTQLSEAESTGRISHVSYIPEVKVDTVWDIGVGDATSIWFVQLVGREIHLVDYFESSGEGLPFYISKLKEKGYNYGTHYAPHDIKVRELGTGQSRQEVARQLGVTFQIVRGLSLDDGIDAVRRLFPKFWFDKEKCSQGLDALASYRKEWDEKRKEYKNHPLHDWSSHAADALRYVAVTYGSQIMQRQFTDGRTPMQHFTRKRVSKAIGY